MAEMDPKSMATLGKSPNGLDHVFSSSLARREEQGRLRRLTLPANGNIDFSSNAYLSLASNHSLQRAYLENLRSCGPQAFSLGSGGSRLLDGNSRLAEILECKIAEFHQAPAGLLFNSGFEANTGLFSCAPQVGDTIVYDELIHASVHDGMKLSRARRVPFTHNCVRDSPLKSAASRYKSLELVLREILQGNDGEAIRLGRANVFVAVEGVYSMDGDVAPLQEIVSCVEQLLPLGNGHIVVDEAHSTGIFGENGQGLVCHLGLEDRIWARLHTFGKAMGCSGAIILCSPTTRSYLINYARSLIYTTAMGFPTLTSIQTSYDFLLEGKAQPLLAKLWTLIEQTHQLLTSLLVRIRPPPEVLRLSLEPPESPIIPLFTTQARSLAQHCQLKGFMIRAIVAPTVPVGSDRVRLCLHAGNTLEEVHGLCNAVEEWVLDQLGEQPRMENERLLMTAKVSGDAESSSLKVVQKSRL